MDLKQLRAECISEVKARLSEEDKEREAIELFRSYEKLEAGINAVKKEAGRELVSLQEIIHKKFEELENVITSLMPETVKAAGVILSAKLLEKAGSLKKLAEMPSSKIQLLGAEKALFRHLKEKSKAPKYGIIFIHESIRSAENKGKAARKLAADIMKAARIDYYRKTI